MTEEDHTPTQQLITLLNDYVSQQEFTLSDVDPIAFREKTMKLARQQSCDLGARSTKGTRPTLLHCLVSGNINSVYSQDIRALLTQDYTVAMQTNWYGKTPISLLFNQSDLCEEDSKTTALIFAELCSQEVLQTALSTGEPLLHHLVRNNLQGKHDQEITFILHRYPALVHTENSQGHSPLQALMKDLINDDDCDLHHLAYNALLLNQHQCDLTVLIPNGSLLHLLASNYQTDCSELITALLQQDPTLVNRVDNQDNIPLQRFLAQPNISLEGMEQLWPTTAGHFIDYNDNGHNLLHTACQSGHLEAAQLLVKQLHLDLHARTRYSNQTMLHLAAHHQHILLWQWLLDNHIDINAADERGQTALHVSINHAGLVDSKWRAARH